MTKEELVTLRERVSEARYVWVRILGGAALEVRRESPGGPETMTDGSAWYRSQGERARFAKELLTPLLPRLRRAQHLLRDVVGEAQNPPPDGERDGTLVDPEWSRCRDISDALRKLLEIA